MKKQKQQFTYRPEVLVEMAQEHLNAAHELMWLTRKANLSTVQGMIDDSTMNEACRRTWSALRDACNMVGADMNVVLATVKALDRHEKGERKRKRQMFWWAAVHLARSEYADAIKVREAAMRRNFAKPDKHSVFVPLDEAKRRPWMV